MKHLTERPDIKGFFIYDSDDHSLSMIKEDSDEDESYHSNTTRSEGGIKIYFSSSDKEDDGINNLNSKYGTSN
jgi:hypothetical protein